MKRRKGYVALIAVLIVSFICIAIITSLSVKAIYILNDLNNTEQGKNVEYILNSCAEESLFRLNVDSDIPVSYAVGDNTCSVTINSQNGDDWNYTVSYSESGYNYSVDISATRSDKVYLNSWKINK